MRNPPAVILISLGMWLCPDQGLPKTPAVERALHPVLFDYEVIRMEPDEVNERVQVSNRLRMQLGSGLLDFRMEQRDLLSPRYRAEVTGEDGVRRQLPPPPVTTFRGTAVVGPEHVQARFTITNERFEGVIFTAGDWLYIEPLRNYVPNAELAELVVYRHSDIKPGQKWRCGASRLERGIHQVDKMAVQSARDATTTYTAEVATEADYEYVRYWGSASVANREIRSILNQVEGVYETELKLNLEIVYQHAWSRSNDPYSGTDGSDLLDQFKEYWNTNFYDSEDYDLAHLWTGRETLTGEDEEGEERELGGIAWTGGVCRYRPWSYGLSKRFTSGPGKFIVTAHEIGHNFDAVHPDEEDPPVASCAGTIMQSGKREAPNERLSFCQFSRNEIRDHVSTWNSCLEAKTETITVNPPSNLVAEAIGSSQIGLTWRDNSTNEITFTISRRAPGKDWDVLVLLPPNRTEFVDAGLLPASTFSYQVFAVAQGSDGKPVYGASNIVTATTLHSDPGGGGKTRDLTRWVIPTMANSPGRGGAYYRTKVILTNFDADLELVVRLYGPNGLVSRRTYSMEANHYRVWGNFLSDFFDYGGAGAVEFSGNAAFTVSAEVYTTSSQGKYTTVVHNGPSPLTPYSSWAENVGGITVNSSTRTNAGVFNNSNQRQTVTARVYYGGEDPDQTLTFSLPPKGWAQKSVSARGVRGYIVWRIPREAYLWVVSVDNRSNDGTLAVPIPLE